MNTTETVELNDLEPVGEVVGGTKTGAGTLTLANTNTYTGLTTVNQGTLDGVSKDIWTSGLGAVDVH